MVDANASTECVSNELLIPMLLLFASLAAMVVADTASLYDSNTCQRLDKGKDPPSNHAAVSALKLSLLDSMATMSSDIAAMPS